MKSRSLNTVFFALTLAALATLAFATEGVSPGETDRLSVTNNPCPTFSWQGDATAMLYEIVGYSLHTGEDPSSAGLTAENEVLYTWVPAGATSWTPSAEQCFSTGGRYVWFVRSVIEVIDDQVIEAGEWSAGRYFQVPAGPTEGEVARAIEVLRRWETVSEGGSQTQFPAPAPVTVNGAASDAVSNSGSGSSHRKSVPTATAAIRGHQSDASGENYGVVGMSSSPDGAGIGAANLVGGPDLVLDGIAQGQTDTHLTQEGIFRSSDTDQIFRLQNPGAGDLQVSVLGHLSAEAVEAEELRTVGWGTVVSEEGHWLGQGDTIPCVDCINGPDVADGQIDVTKLSAQGSQSGQVLKANGSSVVWADDNDGELSIPYSAGGTNSETNFYMGNSGSGWAIHAEAAQNNAIVGDAWHNGTGVLGRQRLASSVGAGVTGLTYSNTGCGVQGMADAAAPDATGVRGLSETGKGVLGQADRGVGVHGEASYGAGVVGISNGADTGGYPAAGLYGTVEGTVGTGVLGVVPAGNGGAAVKGENGSTWGALGRLNEAVYGFGSSSDEGGSFESEDGYGVYAKSAGEGLTGAALYANNTDPAGIAIRANADSTDAALVVGNEGIGALAKFFNGGNLRAQVTNVGDVYIDGAYFVGGADFAELLPAYSDDLEPGDVLAIAADGRLMRSQHAYQASVVGVYSTKPGILGGSGINGDTEGKIPLAVVGVVPVKTCDENGPVRPGDMLVSSSIPGHAMRAGDRAPNGRVIGKALSGLEAKRGEITMLVILQ